MYWKINAAQPAVVAVGYAISMTKDFFIQLRTNCMYPTMPLVDIDINIVAANHACTEHSKIKVVILLQKVHQNSRVIPADLPGISIHIYSMARKRNEHTLFTIIFSEVNQP